MVRHLQKTPLQKELGGIMSTVLITVYLNIFHCVNKMSNIEMNLSFPLYMVLDKISEINLSHNLLAHNAICGF
jgi:hypothetical protein